nr:MAG TPA: hypothetical protein [Caudoviricetes sp.]
MAPPRNHSARNRLRPELLLGINAEAIPEARNGVLHQRKRERKANRPAELPPRRLRRLSCEQRKALPERTFPIAKEAARNDPRRNGGAGNPQHD